MVRTLVAVALLATLIGLPAAQAQPVAGESAPWPQRTLADVEAAYRLIDENHPGAVRALHDDDFLRRLEDGFALAKARAGRVTTYGGYVNTLRGFAGSFGDDHIGFASNGTHAPDPLRWAGFVMSLRGDAYVVSYADPAEAVRVAAGDRLVSCDGIAAPVLAERRLAGFRGDWSAAAVHYRRAPYLLIDYANPFVPTPSTCRFEHQGRPVEVALTWREISGAELSPHFARAAPTGDPGYGVRSFPGGYWISLAHLDEKAAAVIGAVHDQLDAIRRAPLIVVDVRGNGGGNSGWGDQLAALLWGEDDLRALYASTLPDPSCAGTSWRATPGNAKTLDFYAAHPEKFGHSDEFTKMAAALRRAVAAGEPFIGDYVRCAARTPHVPSGAVAGLPPSPLHGKVVMLTDSVCFSSCLMMLAEFRALGAVHAGQPVAAFSHYMEVREEPLPSGLGSFSTLQAVSFTTPAHVGPFVPNVAYDGDVSDTAALERWVPAAVAPR